MTILFLGMSLVTIPEAARVLRRSPRHLPLFCLLITGGLTMAAIAWGVILLVAVPRGFGSWLLGPIWRSTYPLVLPQMLFVVGQGISFGVSTGLHALGASKRSLRQAVLVSVFYVICSIVGALVGGAVGCLWGTALSPWVGAIFGWRQLRVAHREHLRRLAEAGTAASAADPDLTVPDDAVQADPVPPVPVFDAAITMPIPVVVLPAERGKAPAGRARVLVAAGAVAVLAAGATTGWMLAHASAGAQRIADAPARAGVTGRAHQPAITHVRPPAQALEPLSAVSFDPYGNGQGNQQPVPLATDGILATAWTSQWYASANFGGLKPGAGLLLDMGRTVTLSDLRIVLGKIPGANFELRVGAAASLGDLRTAARVTDAGEQADVRLSKPAKGRYVLIWFTKLPPDASGTFQVSVYSVSLEGWT